MASGLMWSDDVYLRGSFRRVHVFVCFCDANKRDIIVRAVDLLPEDLWLLVRFGL